MLTTTKDYQVRWEKLPDDFVLDNEPVDNINQPPLAAALTESLEIADRLPNNALVTTNYGICATVSEKVVVKAPDWAYIPLIRVPREEVFRSYTPQLQGEFPVIVMEFLSDSDGGEYSSKPTYPPGKWFYYEKILRVPNYFIFEPSTGDLELYQLDGNQEYQIQIPDANNLYWIPQMDLFIGVWQGSRENRNGNWLRWWDSQGNLLLWGFEAANQQRDRAERLAAQLRAAGIQPED